jgi:hypothetical protein
MQDKKYIELTEKETKNYKFIGRGSGESIGLCFFLAHKHCKNFEERCVGYRVLRGDKVASMFSEVIGKEYISVEFYEKIN